MGSFYNENDAYAAQWLRNLVAAGALPAGDVDQRSIAEIEPDDLAGYDSCHFFAGIGGWAHALELAGWPDTRPIWTGSPPCQPFSSAGKQSGAADERHLWPLWLRLIRVCRPDTILGEQVAGAVGFGWLDRVSRDLEEIGYACGAAVLGAHSVGAPHIRQRLFWCASLAGGMADAEHTERRTLSFDRQDGRNRQDGGRQETHGEPGTRSQVRRLGVAEGEGPQGQRPLHGAPQGGLHRRQPRLPGNAWTDAAWLQCLDGKARRTQPTIHPLAHGIPNRVGQLRAYGNAIIPQTAALFIETVMAIL